MFFMRMLTHPMEINVAGKDIDNRDQGISSILSVSKPKASFMP
jgi:hypothetical protein